MGERRGFGWHAGTYPGNVPGVNVMPNPQLDQFTSALWWKLVPWLILGGGAGILGGLLVKWLDRRVDAFGRKRLARRAPKQDSASVPDLDFDLTDAPHCPDCNAVMVSGQRNEASTPGNRSGAAAVTRFVVELVRWR